MKHSLDKYISITKKVAIATAAILIIYDGFVMSFYGQEASISKIIIDWGLNYPMVPFGFGVLVGHFFWQLKKDKD